MTAGDFNFERFVDREGAKIDWDLSVEIRFRRRLRKMTARRKRRTVYL
jgi:hypothetical protein